MKNYLTFKESFYYLQLLTIELFPKHVSTFDIVDNVVLSTVITRKNRSIDSSFVKAEKLMGLLACQKPQLSLTTSFITVRSTITRSRIRGFFFFLINYLAETGRYTLSPISALQKQANFTVRDYVFFANFLGIGYDYFGWRFPLRVTFNFLSSFKESDFKFFFHLLFLVYES